MTAQHTPMPWFQDGNGRDIHSNDEHLGCISNPNNAAFIVQAVNAHEVLVKVLEEVYPIIDEYAKNIAKSGDHKWVVIRDLANEIKATLRLARGEG